MGRFLCRREQGTSDSEDCRTPDVLEPERVLEAAVSLADAVGIGMVEVIIMDADGNPVLVDQHV